MLIGERTSFSWGSSEARYGVIGISSDDCLSKKEKKIRCFLRNSKNKIKNRESYPSRPNPKAGFDLVQPSLAKKREAN